MEVKAESSIPPVTGSRESSILFQRMPEKLSPDVIPQWENSEDGQKLFIPSSDDETIIAKAQLSRLLCCYAPFAEGDYRVDWNDKTRISTLITKEQVETFCGKASEYCKFSMLRAATGRKIFYVGLVLILLICGLITGLGVKFDMPWISGLAVLVFVFGIGCLYEIINSRARNIYDTLRGFIEINDDYSGKGIEVRPGPYGAYIEFAIIRAKDFK